MPGDWTPFPAIPGEAGTGYSVTDLFIRPFGLFETDLGINFSQNRRPYLITDILACCTRDMNHGTPEDDFFWDLTIGKRVECLMAIVMSGRASRLPVHPRCLNGMCGEPMEIEFSMEEIAALQHRHDHVDPVAVRIDNREFRFRKPTGRDQLGWLDTPFPDEDAAVRTMIQTLWCRDGTADPDHEAPIPDHWVGTIDNAMMETDPLVNFTLTIHCPHCGREGPYNINLEERLLRELRKARENLIGEIHCLAAHYHWSEGQILSIPPWRRRHYLALIEKQGG
ncbi:MAG: hypothetical protein GY737_17935 [Desulfobacteraceae bacterium]|nr:hypothetical protein [Desulfobacteraceae bacterium]